MRIKVSEIDLRNNKLILENIDIINQFFSKSENIKKKVNQLYNKITFYTVSEILNGEVDLPIYLNKLEEFRTIMYTIHNRINDYFNNMSDEEFDSNPKFADIQMKVDDIYQSIVYKKIDVLEELINYLNDLSEKDIQNNFNDVNTIEL